MHAAGRADPVVRRGPDTASDDRAAFERFVEEAGPRLGRALAAAYGFEDGRDAAAEALAYALGELAPAATHRQPAGLPVPGWPDVAAAAAASRCCLMWVNAMTTTSSWGPAQGACRVVSAAAAGRGAGARLRLHAARGCRVDRHRAYNRTKPSQPSTGSAARFLLGVYARGGLDLGEQIHEFMEHGLHPVLDGPYQRPVHRDGVARCGQWMARSKPGNGRLILAVSSRDSGLGGSWVLAHPPAR